MLRPDDKVAYQIVDVINLFAVKQNGGEMGGNTKCLKCDSLTTTQLKECKEKYLACVGPEYIQSCAHCLRRREHRRAKGERALGRRCRIPCGRRRAYRNDKPPTTTSTAKTIGNLGHTGWRIHCIHSYHKQPSEDLPHMVQNIYERGGEL